MQYSERIFCKFNSILKLDRNHADEISLNTHTEHFKNTTICFNWKEAIRSLRKKTKKKKKKERKKSEPESLHLTVEMARRNPRNSLQSRRILGRDPWIVFRNDVVPPSWTLILPESWDESKSVFKGEVDGFKIGEGEGRRGKNTPLSPPRLPPLVFFVAFQDGGHDQCTS